MAAWTLQTLVNFFLTILCKLSSCRYMKRNQLIAFAEAFGSESGTACYDEEPWAQFTPEELNQKEEYLMCPMSRTSLLHVRTGSRLGRGLATGAVRVTRLVLFFPPTLYGCLFFPLCTHPYHTRDAHALCNEAANWYDVLICVGCSVFELFRPVRDPRLVGSELSESRTTLSGSGLMDELSCPICTGICKEVMVVKDCSHRFCGDCIQKWIRNGYEHDACALC